MSRKALVGLFLAALASSACQDSQVALSELPEHPIEGATSLGECGYVDLVRAPADETIQEEVEEESAEQSDWLFPNPVIDVLVAYTPEARAEQGGHAAIAKLIDQGIDHTNQAFRESGIRASVRLVGTMELRQNDSGDFYRDQPRLKSKGDGFWDEVHRERDRLGADQVTVIGVYAATPLNGLASTILEERHAFSVIKTSSFWRYTMTHEIGHNLGLEHRHGYVNTAGNFRTIMSKESPPRILRFSSRSLLYRGYATGDRAHDSASIVNRNARHVSGYRSSRQN